MTQLPNSYQDRTMKYVVYAAIALLIVNFILMFVPFLKINIPFEKSYSWLAGTTYSDWHKINLPGVACVGLVTVISYLCSIIALIISLKEKNNTSGFFKILNDAVDRPIKFTWLKIGAILNIVSVPLNKILLDLIFEMSDVSIDDIPDAYIRLTFWAVLNIILTVAFVVLLYYLSYKVRSTFEYVKADHIPNAQTDTAGTQNVDVCAQNVETTAQNIDTDVKNNNNEV